MVAKVAHIVDVDEDGKSCGKDCRWFCKFNFEYGMCNLFGRVDVSDGKYLRHSGCVLGEIDTWHGQGGFSRRNHGH